MPVQHHTLFGSLSPREFTKRYWQKKPLLIRGAFPDFRCPVDRNALIALAKNNQVESRVVTERSKPAFKVYHGPFSGRFFTTMPKSHWTLLVQDVDKHLPEVAHLIEPFAFLPRWRIDDIMISYAARAGTVGPHYDNYDVFLLQGAGRRRWRLGPRPTTPKLLRNTELRVLKNFEATSEISVEPGDLLYLPPSIAHHGVAETECITLSIGFRAPSQRELCFDFVENLLHNASDTLRYTDADLRLPEHPGQIDPAALHRVCKLIESALQPKPQQIQEWFGRYVTEPKPHLLHERTGSAITAPALRQRLRKSEGLRRALGAQWAFTLSSRSLSLFVDGQHFRLPKAAHALVAALCDAPAVSAQVLAHAVKDLTQVRLIRALLEQGLLTWIPAQSSHPKARRRGQVKP